MHGGADGLAGGALVLSFMRDIPPWL